MRASFRAILCTLSFHISCAVSAVIAVFETAITAVYVFVFFLNKQIRITDSFSIDYADLLYCLITLSPHSHGLLTLCP